ncbi:uncharacterized protein LAJ45_02900 [Morchella importuna]|uniref:uncharacterized protein n=1 Tax=Morchella importuna TaxID=1174673 RepID=UPI001E8E4900|nr:uncharacterized protein LAJ45_02900 [Morchella importuna]KAH8153313.1 hypothetical protein LAJ45_02900 [Morchella importuna]
MKLQTVLLLLASVVSVHSQLEGAPVLSECLELIESGAAQSASNPDLELQKCLECTHEADRKCLSDPTGDPTTLSQRLTEHSQTRCGEIECAQIIFGTADGATKRDMEESCTGRLCVKPPPGR